jgi:hypothetical protein
MIACKEGILPWVKLLHDKYRRTIKRQWLHSRDLKESTLMEAIHGGHKDIVIWLLDYGYDVNSKFEHSFLGVEKLPAVLFASMIGAYDIVDIFVQRGAVLYGRPLRNNFFQTQRSCGLSTDKMWLRVFIDHCIDFGHGARPNTHDWLLFCIKI